MKIKEDKKEDKKEEEEKEKKIKNVIEKNNVMAKSQNINIDNSFNNLDYESYLTSIFKFDEKKKILKDSIKISINDIKNKISENCIFCLEDFEQNEKENPLLECKNYIHGICFIEYITEELNNNHFPIKCPFCKDNKRHEINYKIVLDILLLNNKDNIALKLENISLNYLVENYPNEITYCPTPGCKYICSYDKNEFNLICPLCHKSYCLQCKTEWHQNLTCEEYQKNKKKEDDENDIKFEEYVKGNNFKQCPNCKRWVEKTQGCDHISCPCGTHFCYNCGGIRDPVHPYDHKCPNDNNNDINRNNMIFMNFMMNQNLNMNNMGMNPFNQMNMNNMGMNPFNQMNMNNMGMNPFNPMNMNNMGMNPFNPMNMNNTGINPFNPMNMNGMGMAPLNQMMMINNMGNNN